MSTTNFSRSKDARYLKHHKHCKLVHDISTAHIIYDYNLDFFNFLTEIRYNDIINIKNIKTVDQLYNQFRVEIFKCKDHIDLLYNHLKHLINSTNTSSDTTTSATSSNDDTTAVTCVQRKNSIKKSISCPIINNYRINCLPNNVHRCIFTSIQANVIQAFKIMDSCFDNKLYYEEFRFGVLYYLVDRKLQLKRNSVVASCLNEDLNQCTLNSSNQYDATNKVSSYIDEDLIAQLFRKFDKNSDGYLDFGEFFREIKAPICPKRLTIINEVFNKLDTNKDGLIKAADLEYWYANNAKTHPKCQTGEWTTSQVLQKTVSYYELPGENTGVITRDKFIRYYSTISATIMNDAYFDLLMRKMFKL